MPSVVVDSRTFEFPDGWLVMKYDATPYYKVKFQGRTRGTRGLKPEMAAVDLIATDPCAKEPTMYLIESKDYRVAHRSKPAPPDEEFIRKVLDTLTGILPTVLCSDSFQHGEKVLREQLKKARKLRLVYHFEQPARRSKLFPRPFDPADLQLRLRSELRAIDPHALVLDSTMPRKVAWSVS